MKKSKIFWGYAVLALAICTVATEFPEVAGANIATTFSCSANFMAAEVASAVSDLLSTGMYSSFFPSIPPAALISSIANFAPSLIDDPYEATAPYNSKLAPILIVSPAALPPSPDPEELESSVPQPANTPVNKAVAMNNEPYFFVFL